MTSNLKAGVTMGTARSLKGGRKAAAALPTDSLFQTIPSVPGVEDAGVQVGGNVQIGIASEQCNAEPHGETDNSILH
jgi:hypothetical protein